MKKNNKGFSIVIAMGLVIFINILAISIIEYVIPFSKATKQIENSTVAYYQANSAIEEALYDLKGKEVGTEVNNIDNFTSIIDSKYSTIAMGKRLPPFGEGNSDFDHDSNQIAMGNPIQIQLKISRFDSNYPRFYFKVPAVHGKDGLELIGDDLAIINRQLSSSTNTLNSTGSYIIEASDIGPSDLHGISGIGGLTFKKGVDLNGEEYVFWKFYEDENCSTLGCILKFSIVNKMETDEGFLIPYLEWRMFFNEEVPLRYSKISTTGKAYGYRKDLEIKVPQETTNEAFDFTVFQ